MKLTNNFLRKEFACKCGCGFDTVDYELITALQKCVDHFSNNGSRKVVVQINCGCRCQKHNADVGGEKKSQHLLGRAADIQLFIEGVKLEPKAVAEFFDINFNSFGIGIYQTFTHIDSRTIGKARW